MSRPLVFLSFSPRDQKWKDLLTSHLRVLDREGLLQVWDDDRILSGSDRRSEIRAALERARVAILLVSADFLDSPSILDEVVPPLLERWASGNLSVIALIVRPCAWESVEWLASFTTWPRNGRPLATESEVEAEDHLAALATKIRAYLGGKSTSPEETALRKRYLEWLIREHGLLELPGP